MITEVTQDLKTPRGQKFQRILFLFMLYYI